MAIHLLQQTYLDSLLYPMDLEQLAHEAVLQVRVKYDSNACSSAGLPGLLISIQVWCAPLRGRHAVAVSSAADSSSIIHEREECATLKAQH